MSCGHHFSDGHAVFISYISLSEVTHSPEISSSIRLSQVSMNELKMSLEPIATAAFIMVCSHNEEIRHVDHR